MAAARSRRPIRQLALCPDQPGVVIVFECDSVETVRRYVDDFPLSKAGLLEWDFIAFDAPLPLEFLFDPQVDLSEPFDRTPRKREGAES
jgi:hypothetical protein